MVDFTSLDVATIGTITRLHNFAKNVETAHLGKLYTTVIDGVDYYVVQCAAKPALANAPEWVSSNRVVNSIQNHKGLTILASGIIALIFFVIMLHPKGDAAKSTDTGSPKGTPPHSDDEKDPGLEGVNDEFDDVKGGSPNPGPRTETGAASRAKGSDSEDDDSGVLRKTEGAGKGGRASPLVLSEDDFDTADDRDIGSLWDNPAAATASGTGAPASVTKEAKKE